MFRMCLKCVYTLLTDDNLIAFSFLLQKHALMERVAHQTMVMQYILELARTLDRDPRSCVAGFFER